MWTLVLHLTNNRTLTIPDLTEKAKGKALLKLLNPDEKWLEIWEGTRCDSYSKAQIVRWEWRLSSVDATQA